MGFYDLVRNNLYLKSLIRTLAFCMSIFYRVWFLSLLNPNFLTNHSSQKLEPLERSGCAVSRDMCVWKTLQVIWQRKMAVAMGDIVQASVWKGYVHICQDTFILNTCFCTILTVKKYCTLYCLHTYLQPFNKSILWNQSDVIAAFIWGDTVQALHIILHYTTAWLKLCIFFLECAFFFW